VAGGRGRFEGLWALLAGVGSALLPKEPREALVRRSGVNPLFWSSALGLVEAVAGPLLLVDSFLRTIRMLVDQNTDAALAAGFAEHQVDPLAVMWGGSFAWLRWLTMPSTMLLVMASVTGAVRLVSASISGEAVGEPLVWLGWRAWRALARPVASAQEVARFGTARPDRVLAQPDGSLVVLSARPHEEWTTATTIEVGERFYRLVETGARSEDGRLWHSALLREEDPTAVIRSLVRYEPPAEAAGAEPRTS
jgi:hypothetical protein